jgi:hypothetical protein
MNLITTYHSGHLDSKFCQVVKSRNDLKIKRVDYIKDPQRSRLILYLESDLLSGQEVNAFMQGMNLVIEAPYLLEYEGPVRRHLVEYAKISDYDKDIYEIGFSEVQLDKGFSYILISCRMISPGLLKVVLSLKKLKNKSDNTLID